MSSLLISQAPSPIFGPVDWATVDGSKSDSALESERRQPLLSCLHPWAHVLGAQHKPSKQHV
eukprot:5325402-Prymnesium_polylepis.1